MAKIISLEDKLQYESYQRYYKKKVLLQKKYPNWLDYGTDDSRNYLREIADLITYDQDFQEFIWDIVPETEQEQMERTARGRYKPQIEY